MESFYLKFGKIMSKVGKNPITIPEGVSVTVKEDANERSIVEVVGKNATLTVPVLQGVSVTIKDDVITFEATGNSKQTRSNWGTMRALVMNAIQGSIEDYKKELIVEGVGFRVTMEGANLVLNVGFSHPVRIATPEGIKISTDKNNITIEGANKEQVGEVAASIRKIKKPEPYKGKGIRYIDEVVRRKVGKKTAGSGK